ncbi:MAG: dTDP-4-dehydrorhamnose reductase [Alphaproteobacteria bacterium]|nr:dTDP-4-dehydrorhamnose reductase [Alphaproteobacteria bacterium]
MAIKRIMLLGATGQIGQAVRAQPLPGDWQLGVYGRAEFDATDHQAMQSAIQTFKPDLIINAAAMTAVDKCEIEQDAAMEANFEAPAHLAVQCGAADIPLIHLSTDYVFDGTENRPYRTDDAMNPLSTYGQSKMMGEESIRHELAWHVILRVSSVFSAFGTNLLTKTLQMIDERDELKIVTDQKSCPTPAQDIAKAVVVMGDAILRGKSNGFGTFHFCGTPDVTRLEFVTDIMNAYAPYTAKRPKITPALSADFPGFAQRPAYSSLDCSRIQEIYGLTQRPWRDGLAEAMDVLMHGKRKVA